METIYALVQANLVANVIVADAAFAVMIAPDWQAVILLNQPDGSLTPCGIGWGWDGTNFIDPNPVEPVEPV